MSEVLTAPVAMCFTPFQQMSGIALRDLSLVFSCSTMKTYFMKLLMHRSCAGVTGVRYSLCGLPLYGCAVVTPKMFLHNINTLNMTGADLGMLHKSVIFAQSS